MPSSGSTSSSTRHARISRFIKSRKLDLTLEKTLGAGSFGTVYRGKFGNRPVAIKVENADRSSSLGREYGIYKYLFASAPSRQNGNDAGGGSKRSVSVAPNTAAAAADAEKIRYVGIPRCLLFYADDNRYRLLVLPYLGRNLKTMMTQMKPDRKFSEQTTALVGLQVLNHLEFIHSKGVVHRDVKPANLCIGSNGGIGSCTVYLVDFGLSRYCIDRRTGKHTRFRQGRGGVTGTLRYMSVYSHQSMRAARRDDLQSLAYMLIYFSRGSLPWQRLVDKAERYSHDSRRKKVHRARVLKMKQTIPLDELCNKNVPSCVRQLLEYSSRLEFEEMPDYATIKKWFWKFLENKYGGVSYERLDWVKVDKTN